ncbi:hypothetical protein BJ944DRAFT_238475 [Cunninghamella echinulata]|nr:hypothetical protein BJ944DRAFT_238475 [Cunninghamella echinulata]
MTLYVSSHPASPTSSPTRTLKSENMDGIDHIDYLDPLFPEILSSNLIEENQTHHYNEHDIPSPSSSSTSAHDTSSTTTPSPISQYDMIATDIKHIIPTEILNDTEHNLLQSSLTIPESYHHLTNEYYSRNSNIFNSTLLTSPLSDTLSASTLDESLQIRVLGIPNLGAKSRVETQIKLCIQLLTSNGTKVPNWSYLRLPESMLARSKLRKTQQQKLLDGSVATMVSDESKVLSLDAKVICSTNPSKSVRMCHGCVRRERKRAERTKDGKPKYETDLLNVAEDPKRLAEEMMEKDRDRILLFNCSPMVNFSSGDAILPTRITCYCRHHNEKIGFKIQFVMRNDQGIIVAKGCSPPIMITDDHKSSKQRNGSIASNSTTATSKKRGRSDFEPHQALDTPASSRRNSFSDNNQYNSSSKLPLNPSLSFTIPSSSTSSRDQSPSTPPEELHHIITPNSSLSSSPQTAALIGNDLSMTPLIMDDTSHHHQLISSESMAELLNSTRTPSTEDTLITNYNDNIFFPQPINNNNNNNNTNSNENDILWPQSRRRRIGNNDYSTTTNTTNISTPTTSNDNNNALWSTNEHTPQLERLVPSQGPTYGGVEVTVLGSGFYRGLTCLFGEHAASTVYWNPNTLVCVLPPAATPGPVVVSFKEHPIVLEGQDVALFTYYDASDQALLELALQVVGLKMTGKLLDAKHIAMLIVRGDQQRNQQYQQQQHNQQDQQDQLESNQLSENKQEVEECNNDDYELDSDYDSEYDSEEENGEYDNDSLDEWNWRGDTNLEKHIIDALEASNTLDMTHTNPCGHTMLHLAVLLQYGSLVKVLIDKMDKNIIDQQDRNNCTALHFACLQNNAPMVSLLLQAGARPDKKCDVGHTFELTTDNNIRSLLQKQQQDNTLITAPPPLSRRLSFKSHVRRFYRLKQSDGNQADNNNNSSGGLDEDGLGFAHYKHDKRLYIFWLPLLIVTIGLLYYQILGDRTLLTLLQDVIPFQRHRHHLPSLAGY